MFCLLEMVDVVSHNVTKHMGLLLEVIFLIIFSRLCLSFVLLFVICDDGEGERCLVGMKGSGVEREKTLRELSLQACLNV